MIKLFYISSFIVFIWAYIKVLIYFIDKSKEKFKEAIKAYKEFKEAERDIKGVLK